MALQEKGLRDTVTLRDRDSESESGKIQEFSIFLGLFPMTCMIITLSDTFPGLSEHFFRFFRNAMPSSSRMSRTAKNVK